MRHHPAPALRIAGLDAEWPPHPRPHELLRERSVRHRRIDARVSRRHRQIGPRLSGQRTRSALLFLDRRTPPSDLLRVTRTEQLPQVTDVAIFRPDVLCGRGRNPPGGTSVRVTDDLQRSRAQVSEHVRRGVLGHEPHRPVRTDGELKPSFPSNSGHTAGCRRIATPSTRIRRRHHRCGFRPSDTLTSECAGSLSAHTWGTIARSSVRSKGTKS